jgi:hypothetical protein
LAGLAEACFDSEPFSRPTFGTIVSVLCQITPAILAEQQKAVRMQCNYGLNCSTCVKNPTEPQLGKFRAGSCANASLLTLCPLHIDVDSNSTAFDVPDAPKQIDAYFRQDCAYGWRYQALA